MKLFGFLLIMLFIRQNGNAQSVDGYIDDSSALVHFPFRDSVITELECLIKQHELELEQLYEELERLFPKQSCFGPRLIYDHRDSLVLERKVAEIETYEFETNKLLEEKVRELNELVFFLPSIPIRIVLQTTFRRNDCVQIRAE